MMTAKQVTASGSNCRISWRSSAAVNAATDVASIWRSWLLIEQLGDDTLKYYLSNLPADTPLPELVRLAHQRWAFE